MKTIIYLATAIVFLASCKKDDEVAPNQTTDSTTGSTATTGMVYSGDNITGHWKLDSVFTQYASSSGELPPVIIDTIDLTIEIYGKDDDFQKTSVIGEGVMMRVDGRGHGRLYGGLSYQTDYFCTGFTSTQENYEEGLYYNVLPLQFRNYRITDEGVNNHLTVTAEGIGYNSTDAFIEYYHRVE